MIDGRASKRSCPWRPRVAVVVALTAAGWLASTGSASAHAALASTDPPADAVLTGLPAQVRLTFTEPVQVSAGAVRVYDPDGRPVDDGRVVHPVGAGPAVQVGLLPGTAQGSYTVSWRVVSADSHPVAGAFTFAVGHPSATALAGGPPAPGGDPTVSALYALVRALGFGAFAALVGTVTFALACRPECLRRSPMRRLALGGWGALLAATLTTLVLQGPYGRGAGLGDALSPGMIASTLDLPLGAALAARVLLLGVIAVYLGELIGRLPVVGARVRMVFAAVGSVLAGALATTWAVAGHASSGIQPGVAVPVDVIHLLAMAVWLGGLAALTMELWPRWAGVDPPRRELVVTVGRFSRIAFGCVVVLVATGTYQSWRQMGGWVAFVTTDYGRLLLVKLVVVAALLGAAGFSRRAASRMRDPLPVNPTGVQLRRSVLAETAVAVVVLAVTAVLVNTEPSRTELARAVGPARTTVSYDTRGPAGAGTMEVLLDPARPGRNEIRVMVRDRGGALRDVPELDVALAMPERNIGPLRPPTVRDGIGSYRADGQLPVAGSWQLALTVRTSDIDQTTVRVTWELRRP